MNLHEIAREIVEEMPEEERKKAIDEIIQRKDEKCEAVSEEEAIKRRIETIYKVLNTYSANNYNLDKEEFDIEDYSNKWQKIFIKGYYKVVSENTERYIEKSYKKGDLADSLENYCFIEKFIETFRPFYDEQGEGNDIDGTGIIEKHSSARKSVFEVFDDLRSERALRFRNYLAELKLADTKWLMLRGVYKIDIVIAYLDSSDFFKDYAIYDALDIFERYIFNIKEEYIEKTRKERTDFFEFTAIADIENATKLMTSIIHMCLLRFRYEPDQITKWVDGAILNVKLCQQSYFEKRKSREPDIEFCYRKYSKLFLKEKQHVLNILKVLCEEDISNVPLKYRIMSGGFLTEQEIREKFLEGSEERKSRMEDKINIAQKVIEWMISRKEIGGSSNDNMLIKAAFREIYIQKDSLQYEDAKIQPPTIAKHLLEGKYDKNVFYDKELEYLQWKIKRGLFREQGIMQWYPYYNKICQKFLRFQETVMELKGRDIDEPLVWLTSYQSLAKELKENWKKNTWEKRLQ